MSTIADVDERLMAEFEGRIGLDVVSSTVLRCRKDLTSPSDEALPELVERLARQRLLDLLEQRGEQ